MKKRDKKGFSVASRNVLLALLVVAAAVTVYGIAQAAIVSHPPSEIQPQGPGSGLDSDTLWGLTSADMLSASAGGGTGGSLIQWGVGTAPGEGAAACPPGWMQSYSGYGPFFLAYLGGTSAAGASSDICSSSSEIKTGVPGTGSVSACVYGVCNTCRVCVPSTTAEAVSAGATVIYATATAYNGNLGGRSGADAKCAAALPPELSGKVTNAHAFLTVSGSDEIRDMHTVDSDWDGVALNYYETAKPIFGYNKQWARWTMLASDWKDLLDGSIMANLNTATAVGEPMGYSIYWTGSTAFGALNMFLGNCNGWTTSSSTLGGTIGKRLNMGSEWLTSTAAACNSALPILCAAKYGG